MLGAKHQLVTDWLVNDWVSDNRRICVIEGFSGVGKTEVASEFERLGAVVAKVDAPESGDINDLMLILSEQLAAVNNIDLANAIAEGRTTDAAFEALLMKPGCIVIDEFQRMLDSTKSSPTTPIASLLERVSKRAGAGRLLLLSHYALDKTFRWSERVVFKTLEGLSEDEGALLLGQLLADRGREADIPPARRPEISRWLGGNPRALGVLVGSLESEALDDLTGIVPEAWEARDQEVSAQLIASLERELMHRALENLDGASASALEGVSVYRTPIDSSAIELLLPPGLTLENFKAALSSRFLLQQRGGKFSLNPVAREISLHRQRTGKRAEKVLNSTEY